MGSCAELTAKEYGITRQQQDEYAITSYKRSADAVSKGLLKKEIIPVLCKGKKGEHYVSEDEEYKNVDFSKVPSLRPAFESRGTFHINHSSYLAYP